jgi:hypothetical protein
VIRSLPAPIHHCAAIAARAVLKAAQQPTLRKSIGTERHLLLHMRRLGLAHARIERELHVWHAWHLRHSELHSLAHRLHLRPLASL